MERHDHLATKSTGLITSLDAPQTTMAALSIQERDRSVIANPPRIQTLPSAPETANQSDVPLARDNLTLRPTRNVSRRFWTYAEDVSERDQALQRIDCLAFAVLGQQSERHSPRIRSHVPLAPAGLEIPLTRRVRLALVL